MLIWQGGRDERRVDDYTVNLKAHLKAHESRPNLLHSVPLESLRRPWIYYRQIISFTALMEICIGRNHTQTNVNVNVNSW